MAEQHERPPAPGGPLRQDEPSGGLAPGVTPQGARSEDDDDRGGSGSVPPPTGTDPEQDDEARDLQAENAETSLDQPSS